MSDIDPLKYRYALMTGRSIAYLASVIDPHCSIQNTVCKMERLLDEHFSESVTAGTSNLEKKKPNKEKDGYKYQEQDRLILSKIRDLGHDPTSLPKREKGKPWVKSQVRKDLDGKEPFSAKTAFDEAWKRLTRQSDIAEQKTNN